MSEEEASSSLGDFTVTMVDPRETGWQAKTLFNRIYKFRIILPEKMNWFAATIAGGAFGKMMGGEEGEDWFVGDNQREIYCRSITFLMLARLYEDTTFETYVGRIEERNDIEDE